MCTVLYTRLIRDLDLLGRKVFLHLEVRQFYCEHCDRHFSEQFNFVRKNSIVTIRQEKCGWVIDMLPSRDKTMLINHFSSKGAGFLNQIEVVTCDMWEGYVNVSKELFVNAQVVIDRFHWMKHLTKAVDSQRKLERNWISFAKQLGNKYLNKFIKTFENWKDLILNYFNYRHSNGIVEGLNNSIKTIKRQTYGMLNFKHFRTRVLLYYTQ